MDRNFSLVGFKAKREVVPYVGTWIEIQSIVADYIITGVVPYVGTWIKIQKMVACRWIHPSRSLRGNVDRNVASVKTEEEVSRRSLRGNVDRNINLVHEHNRYRSRSLRGNVDRNNVHNILLSKKRPSFPTWERG